MPRRQAGSSIIEALAATVVISVGVLGIAVLTGGLIQGNRRSDRLGSASFAATDQIERLLAGAPVNADTDLLPGSHPPDQSGQPRYEGLGPTGAVANASVPGSSANFDLLRRWVVSNETSSRCLRRVRVSVWNPGATVELAAAESFVNCP